MCGVQSCRRRFVWLAGQSRRPRGMEEGNIKIEVVSSHRNRRQPLIRAIAATCVQILLPRRSASQLTRRVQHLSLLPLHICRFQPLMHRPEGPGARASNRSSSRPRWRCQPLETVAIQSLVTRLRYVYRRLINTDATLLKNRSMQSISASAKGQPPRVWSWRVLLCDRSPVGKGGALSQHVMPDQMTRLGTWLPR